MQSKMELYNKFIVCNQIDSSSQEILKNLYIDKFNLNEFMIDNIMLQKKLKISYSHLKLVTDEKLKIDKHYKINLIMNNNRGRPKQIYHYNKIGLMILLDNINIIESEKLKKDIKSSNPNFEALSSLYNFAVTLAKDAQFADGRNVNSLKQVCQSL